MAVGFVNGAKVVKKSNNQEYCGNPDRLILNGVTEFDWIFLFSNIPYYQKANIRISCLLLKAFVIF